MLYNNNNTNIIFLKNVIIKTALDLEAIGEKVAKKYTEGGVILLSGELGAGKTTLVRGALRSLGVTGAVKSPTYTIVETYGTPEITVQHFDLYRMNGKQELEEMGFRDYLQDKSLIFIEWPERALDFLTEVDCHIRIQYHSQGREVSGFA